MTFKKITYWTLYDFEDFCNELNLFEKGDETLAKLLDYVEAHPKPTDYDLYTVAKELSGRMFYSEDAKAEDLNIRVTMGILADDVVKTKYLNAKN